jgi:hypothetical protein
MPRNSVEVFQLGGMQNLLRVKVSAKVAVRLLSACTVSYLASLEAVKYHSCCLGFAMAVKVSFFRDTTPDCMTSYPEDITLLATCFVSSSLIFDPICL